MLSYQHSYHAGGPADVHKHVALTLLLRQITAKPKPATVIDLYAGGGVYRLAADEAQKTGEYRDGIAKLWNNPAPELAAYIAAVRKLNAKGLDVYPGSPELARQALRPGDQLILNELHPGALHDLKRWAGGTGLAKQDAEIAVHKRDGLEGLLGLVPPAIRRGLVLIDPSYEMKTDYTAIPETLAKAVAKWREGIFMIWYPVLADARHRPLLTGISAIPSPSVCVELTLPKPKTEGGLRGTGVIVVNPPWKFDTEMAAAGLAVAKGLGGKHSLVWLNAPPP